MTLATRKIGINRGTPRLWLEGSILVTAGFFNGLKFNYGLTPQGFMLVLDPEGKSKVAGTLARPIIDINSTKKLSMFSVGQVVHIDIATTKDKIYVYA